MNSKNAIVWLADDLKQANINVEASRSLFNTLLQRRMMRFRRKLITRNPLHFLHENSDIVLNNGDQPQCK